MRAWMSMAASFSALLAPTAAGRAKVRIVPGSAPSGTESLTFKPLGVAAEPVAGLHVLRHLDLEADHRLKRTLPISPTATARRD